MAELFDTHAHLDFPDFSQDLEAVLERARAAGVVKIISIGTDLASSRRAVALAERYAGVYAAVGWHPGHAAAAPEDARPALIELAAHPKVVAVGEIGLDFYRLPSRSGGSPEDDERARVQQRRLFQQQLEAAAECGLNCIIHCREAFLDILAEVRPWAGSVRALFHCFAESPEALAQILPLNGLVSFTGIVTFKNADTVRASAAAAPLGKFMVETDAPFLAPSPHRGKRCEPAYAALTAQRIAELRGCRAEDLSAATCAAALDFFPKLDA